MSANAAKGSRSRQHGYVLLALLLMVALIIIAAGIAAPTIAFEIRRDREEELIHRGFQYTRAIRLYASKNGRYPLKLEDLEGTNGIRYIRRLYKDPLTGGDFKLLHLADMPSIGGMPNVNANTASNFAGSPGFNPASPRLNQNNFNSQQPAQGDQGQADPSQADPNNANNSTDQQAQSGANSSDAIGNANQSNPSGAQQSAGTQTIGTGGVIFGVASKSKDKTIREFNRKNHYNDWLFFYYPPYGARERNTPTSLIPMTGQGLAANGAGQPPNQNGSQQPAQQQNSDQGQPQQ